MRLGQLVCTILPILSSCASGIADPVVKELTTIGNAGIADIQHVEAIANVPNPGMPGGIEDQDGLDCARAAAMVLAQINAVNGAANGPGAGVLTLAEMASLFQPGSPQWTQANNTLAAGCIKKANDVLGPQGVIAAGGVVGAMVASSRILPLLAAGAP